MSHSVRFVLHTLVLSVAVGAGASCSAKSPLAPSVKAQLDHIELQWGGYPYGGQVFLQNGLPTFYPASGGSTYAVTVYAVDSDGAYQDVTSRSTFSSSSFGVASVVPNAPYSTVAITLRGSGQATVTASYSGLNSSLTFVVAGGKRPCPAVTTSLDFYGVYEDVLTFTNVDNPSCNGLVTNFDFSMLQWTSSNPQVISVSGSHLRTVGVGVTDITLRYGDLQSVYRVTVPPVGRLGLLQ